MDSAAISALHYSRPFLHSPRGIKITFSPHNLLQIASNIERELTLSVNDFRSDLELSTSWDTKLGHILGMALNAYEVSDLYDIAPDNSEFQQAVKRTVPDGHTFK